MYPKDKIKNYERTRNRFLGFLFPFSIGAFFNLIPFMDFTDLGSITNVQWLFLIGNTIVLVVSLLIYIYYWFRINGIKKKVIKGITSS